MREELSSLKRANFVIINGKKNKNIEEKILNKNTKIKIFNVSYQPENIEKFSDKKIYAFAGIGNPKNFFDMLEEYKINVVEKKYFPDHYNYSDNDIKNLFDKSKELSAILLTTEKDYFRIKNIYKKNINFLKIKLKMENKEKFVEDIKRELWKE